MTERSVRLRLVLGATSFVAIAIGIALITGRILISDELHDSAVSLARSDLIPFATDLRNHPDEPPDPPGSGVLIGIQDAAGTWILDTLPDEVARAVDGRTASVLDVPDHDGDRSWVAVGEPSETSDGPVVLWSAREVTAADRSTRSIDILFIAGGLALVGLFAGAATVFVRSALRPVEAARRRERQFVSDAAHELRTPLAGLQAQLAVVRSRVTDATVVREIERVEASAERLGGLASNLLELARLDEGTPSGSASVGEAREAFLAVIDEVRASAGSAGVSIDHTTPPSVPDRRIGLDSTSFGRIVRNLLVNAATATGSRGSVNAELAILDGDLVVRVQDDGPGIPEDLMPRVLDRFARGGSSGSGLGLALVDALARAAGGDVVLRNTQPGVEATVRIPLY
jgi:signal transduction histidine kinase